MTKRMLAAAAVWMIAVCGLSAQQTLEETIEVSIVNVDVLVTDKQGNRVTGLRAEDFELLENGKRQPITNFSEYSPAPPAPSVAIEPASADVAPPAAPRPRRTIIVFIEPVPLPNFRAKELFDSIRELLRGTVGPGDQVAIMTWAYPPRVRQGFTDDLGSLMKTLDAVEAEAMSMWSYAGGIGGQTTEPFIRERSDLGHETGGVLSARGLWHEIKLKTAVLESLMHGISGVEGRKILIMATRRFGQYAGAEFFQGTVPASYRSELDTSRFRQSLIRTANANGITLYPIMPEGLRWSTLSAAVEAPIADDTARMGFDNLVLLNETMAMDEVAAGTGGLTAWGSTAIAALLPRVRDDLDAYYSLGYRARTTGEDRVRDIVVKVKHPGYVVRSRRQVVEKSPETRMSDRVVARLFQPIDGSTLDFDVAMGALEKTKKNRWSTTLTIRIPIAELTVLPRGRAENGEFTVFVATGGDLGVTSEVDQRSQPFSIAAAELARAKKSHFTYEFRLDVDDGADRVSVGVWDEVGKEYGVKMLEMGPRR